jgi:hypothetical protein
LTGRTIAALTAPVKSLASLDLAKRKKSRTPAPPRRTTPAPGGDGQARQVQAPKVRSGKRRTQADVERRNRMILYGVAATGVLGLAIALIVVFAAGRGGGGAPRNFDGPNVQFPGLPGAINAPPPWKANAGQLDARLKKLGLAPLQQQEGNLLHIHQHLDIFVNGRRVTIPALIGIKRTPQGTEFAELHTHGADGIIHVESFRAQTVSLGQFFGVWGVRLAPNCVGGLCTPPDPIAFYVNGHKLKPTDDPVRLVLQDHQEIAVVYGKPPGEIPSSYDFAAAGL